MSGQERWLLPHLSGKVWLNLLRTSAFDPRPHDWRRLSQKVGREASRSEHPRDSLGRAGELEVAGSDRVRQCPLARK